MKIGLRPAIPKRQKTDFWVRKSLNRRQNKNLNPNRPHKKFTWLENRSSICIENQLQFRLAKCVSRGFPVTQIRPGLLDIKKFFLDNTIKLRNEIDHKQLWRTKRCTCYQRKVCGGNISKDLIGEGKNACKKLKKITFYNIRELMFVWNARKLLNELIVRNVGSFV